MTRRAWILFMSIGIVWGVPSLFIKVAVEHLAPPVVVFGRTAIAVAAAGPRGPVGRDPSGPHSVAPTAGFIHIWRVTDGKIVEHWACRDHTGLREQLRR